MGAARTTVVLGFDSDLDGRAFRSVVRGEGVGLLVVLGEGAEVSMFGPPAALRRLASD
ncbi:MAG: hypothetical protein ABSG43_23980 [Solirubrobacteraceae bacterium]|jgi:hypothetical protein